MFLEVVLAQGVFRGIVQSHISLVVHKTDTTITRDFRDFLPCEFPVEERTC